MNNPPIPELKQDPLGRFSRDCPVSTGKLTSPTERDLIWFQALHRHGDLTSEILHAFTEDTHKSSQHTRRRLTDLWRESNTPHKGRYLDRPWQRNLTPNVRSNYEIYTLNDKSAKVLKAHSLYRSNTPKCSSSWRHDLIRSCYSASMELGCKKHGLDYIHHDEVVSKIGTDHFIVDDQKVRPDLMHGIRYGSGTVRLFLVEIDCSTEPIRSGSKKRHKSIQSSFVQYKKFISGGMYKTALKIESGVLLITLTTNLTHMHNLIAEAGTLFDNGCNYMLFGFIPNFEFYFKPPSPLYEFVDQPWLRAGKEPFSII